MAENIRKTSKTCQAYRSEEGSNRRLATEQDIKQLRMSEEGWNYTVHEEMTLENLRTASQSERLEMIKNMTEAQRRKFDGLLPRAMDPEGLDKVPDVPLLDPFGNPIVEPDCDPFVAPRSGADAS